MKKALSVILAAGLALAGVPPIGAQVVGPNAIWGNSPQSASAAATAVLLDASGRTVATVPIAGGRFTFRDLPAGQYVVALQTATGQELARSFTVDLVSGGEIEALFSPDAVVAAVPPGAAAAAAAGTGGGIGTTGWILIAAGAVGIATAIVIATNDDDDVASPSR